MFADANLLGLPRRVVVSEQTIKKDSFELKSRQDPKVHLLKLDKLAGALHA